MNQSNLILHCGAAKTERSELALVCTPDADNTWCPIPHQTLVAEVEGALTRANMRIVTEAHGLSADGARYFGLCKSPMAMSRAITPTSSACATRTISASRPGSS